MDRIYSYVGPISIKENISPDFPGKVILNQKDVKNWITSTNQMMDEGNSITATYVISEDLLLLISDRHDEHVSCASAKSVFSAGEITFSVEEDVIEIIDITNQSTGYCPEPSSWVAVEKALKKTSMNYPDYFTSEFIFRKCPSCSEINVVKDNYFYCAMCENELPLKYNIG